MVPCTNANGEAGCSDTDICASWAEADTFLAPWYEPRPNMPEPERQPYCAEYQDGLVCESADDPKCVGVVLNSLDMYNEDLCR